MEENNTMMRAGSATWRRIRKKLSEKLQITKTWY
jgi:hypothetical protein